MTREAFSTIRSALRLRVFCRKFPGVLSRLFELCKFCNFRTEGGYFDICSGLEGLRRLLSLPAAIYFSDLALIHSRRFFRVSAELCLLWPSCRKPWPGIRVKDVCRRRISYPTLQAPDYGVLPKSVSLLSPTQLPVTISFLVLLSTPPVKKQF